MHASRTTPCPSCGAGLRPGSPWCTLCYADLRPAQPVAAMPSGVPSAPPSHASFGPAAPDPLTQPLLDFISAPSAAVEPEQPQRAPDVVSSAVWPCVACHSLNALSASECAACGLGFLAGTIRPASFRLPLVGDLYQLSRAQRLLGAVGVAVVLAVALVLLLSLLVAIVPG